MTKIKDSITPGVVTGDKVQELFAYAKANQFALPGVNVTGTNTVNAVLETAREVNSPVIIQFSNGGALFFAGKGLGIQSAGFDFVCTVRSALNAVFLPNPARATAHLFLSTA